MEVLRQIYNSFRRSEDRYFPTPNLRLATVLFSLGFALVNLDRTDPPNCQFAFRNSYDLEEMVERFNSKKPIFVDARKFIFWRKLLRRKINEERFK